MEREDVGHILEIKNPVVKLRALLDLIIMVETSKMKLKLDSVSKVVKSGVGHE